MIYTITLQEFSSLHVFNGEIRFLTSLIQYNYNYILPRGVLLNCLHTHTHIIKLESSSLCTLNLVYICPANRVGWFKLAAQLIYRDIFLIRFNLVRI